MSFNDFFSLCRPQDGESLNDAYKCCIDTCTRNSPQPYGCYSMCAQMFAVIKDQCAFEHECWRDGFYNKKCLEAKAPEIKACCIKRCQEYRTNPYSYTVMDCDRYCSDYSLK